MKEHIVLHCMGVVFSPFSDNHHIVDGKALTQHMYGGMCHLSIQIFLTSASTKSLIHTHDSYLPPSTVQEQWMGRGIPLAVSPHPETCQPCRCKPAGIGHS